MALIRILDAARPLEASGTAGKVLTDASGTGAPAMAAPRTGHDPFGAAKANAESLFGGVQMDYALTVWVFVATSLILAFIAWRQTYAAQAREQGRRTGPLGYLAFVFPKKIYFHRSTWVDLQLIVINQLFSPFTLAAAALLTGVIAAWISSALSQVFPAHDPHFSWSFWPLFAFTLAIALASDLATYVVHRLNHTIPALWEIHKTHHSAEVMSPLTIFRKHPLFDVQTRTLKALLVGPVQGVLFFAFAGPTEALHAFGANLVFSTFHMLGAGLRHSHIWLSYGPVLNRLFISPAQHQIHHSRAEKHWDKNFGQMFAIWDWMFGTLYLPKAYEKLEFGIEGVDSRAYGGVWGGLIRPPLQAIRVMGQTRSPAPQRLA